MIKIKKRKKSKRRRRSYSQDRQKFNQRTLLAGRNNTVNRLHGIANGKKMTVATRRTEGDEGYDSLHKTNKIIASTVKRLSKLIEYKTCFYFPNHYFSESLYI